uniref:Chitin-binding type-2 domain-containing protein n=1 Tax=Globodera pallida TaxID=36090 RepID=A0A183BZ66_GLOPA
MRFIPLFIIIIEMLFANCSGRLKCRRNTVGTIKGVDLERNFSEEECDSTYFWQASNKYCFAAHCFKGNEWLTHYGCTTSAERGTCSDKVGKELKDLFGLVVSCSFCTIGRKNFDMSNNNFPLYNQSVPNQTSSRDFDSTMVPPSTETASFDVTSETLMPSDSTTVPSTETASFDVTSETLMPSDSTTVPSTETASFDVTSETPNETMSMSVPLLETLTKMAAPFAEFCGKSSGTGLNIALPILIVSMTSVCFTHFGNP